MDCASEVRRGIAAQTQCTATVGVGASGTVARLAMKSAKPDGLRIVRAEESVAFLAPRPIQDLPKVGPRIAEKLIAAGARCVQGANHF